MFREAVVVVLLVSMGCIGGLDGGSELSFAADPVRIDDSAVQESPFTVTAERPIEFNQSISVGGDERNVNLRVGMVQAKQTGNTPVPAQLIVLSVPEVQILGESVSVADQFDPLLVIDQSENATGRVEQDRKVTERAVRILSAFRTVSVYRGTKTSTGSEASVLIYKSTFQHNDDTIVIVGIVPVGMDDTSASLLELLNNIDRP